MNNFASLMKQTIFAVARAINIHKNYFAYAPFNDTVTAKGEYTPFGNVTKFNRNNADINRPPFTGVTDGVISFDQSYGFAIVEVSCEAVNLDEAGRIYLKLSYQNPGEEKTELRLTRQTVAANEYTSLYCCAGLNIQDGTKVFIEVYGANGGTQFERGWVKLMGCRTTGNPTYI